MAKAILIDSAARALCEIDVSSLRDLQQAVGGPIEAAYHWRNRNTLYIDEEGLFKPQRAFFRLSLRDNPQPLAGNGLVVGHELIDEEGEYQGLADVAVTIASLQHHVTFLSREQADAWAKGNASEPALSFYEIGSDGKIIERAVFRRMGSVFDDMPRPPEDDDTPPEAA